MSALTRSIACGGVFIADLAPEFHLDQRDANHELCPGRQTQSGVLGGWTCDCPCHAAVSPYPKAEEPE